MDIVIDDPGQRAGVFVLLGFLGSFAFIRMSTRLMRSPRVPWWPGSIESSSGIHVHHLVFGILLMIGAGFCGFAIQPEGFWMDVFAALFGIGVGLTVDEFALWLYLEDVYWTREGRSSVDMAIVIGLLGLLVLAIGGPFDTSDPDEQGEWFIVTGIVLHLAWAAVVLCKGKIRLALIGFWVPPVYVFAAIRLARPNSIWARRFYKPGGRKLEKATARATRWDERRERWLDRIGGTPHLERPPRVEELASEEDSSRPSS
jgi:hypothetical protein